MVYYNWFIINTFLDISQFQYQSNLNVNHGNMNQDINTTPLDIDMSNMTDSIILFHNNYIINSVKHICNLINLKYISINVHDDTIV